MATAKVESVTLTLSSSEAWALRNALGAMSTARWQEVGINADGIRAVGSVYVALNDELTRHHPD